MNIGRWATSPSFLYLKVREKNMVFNEAREPKEEIKMEENLNNITEETVENVAEDLVENVAKNSKVNWLKIGGIAGGSIALVGLGIYAFKKVKEVREEKAKVAFSNMVNEANTKGNENLKN